MHGDVTMRIMATSDWHGNLEGLEPKGADVVVLAGDIAPLRISGSDVDRSLQTDSEHFGSPELAEAIMEKHSRFVFCGHIHTGQHGGEEFGSSRIYNVSRLDERYEVAYEPTWVEVS